MIELSINSLSKFYGAKQILKNISFDLKTGERVGLIGQNGCGKTTLFKILMGLEDYQGGEISIRKGARLGYLDQIPEYEEGITVLQVLEGAFEDLYHIKHRLGELEERLGVLEGEALNRALETYGRLMEQFEMAGGYEIETRINKTTEGLQIDGPMLRLPFHSLSGGEKARVVLAKLLLEEPDILLLDEPSNHLDLTAVEWLEGFLKDYKGTLLVISHDRYFLDAVANRIIELRLDQADIYQGNYSWYVAEKERRFLIDLKNYQNELRKIERMEEQIARYRIWGEMRDSDKMFNRAKELEKRLEKLDTPVKPILENRKIRLNREAVNRSGKLVLEAEGISKSFGDKELLKEIGFTLFYQDSACILGRNGCGKSTFLKLIIGELMADKGVLRTGSQVSIGYLPQNVVFEDEELTIVDYFSRLHNITTGEARSHLAKVLFCKEDVNKKLRFLSGGEKSRLKLCSLTLNGANLLILDEPTNHLDIDSREVLEETLMSFPGTLLFVSHDRYFINKVADRILAFEDGNIRVYNGDYSYYLEESGKEASRAKEMPATAENPMKAPTNSANPLKVKPGSTMGRQKLLSQLEEEIEGLEARKKLIGQQMEENSAEAGRLKELYDELRLLEGTLTMAYEKWEQALEEAERT